MEVLKVVLASVLSAVSLFIIAKIMGHKSAKEILLAVCDDNKQLTLFV